MGQLFARQIEPWYCDGNYTHLIQEKVTETDVATRTVRGWLQQAEHSTLILSRQFVGLRKHDSAVGETRANFVFRSGGGAQATFKHRADESYTCVDDDALPRDTITGEGVQVQRWEYISPFEPVPGSYFEETLELDP